MVTKDMLKKLDFNKQMLFGIFCVRQLFNIANIANTNSKDKYFKAIEMAEHIMQGGKVDYQTLFSLEDTICQSLVNAARYPGMTYINIADVAENVAKTKFAKSKIVLEEQLKYYNELLNFDKIVEELLGL